MLASSLGISSSTSLKPQHSNPNPKPKPYINSGVLTFLLLPHLSTSLTDSLPSLNLLCHSKTDTRFMQDPSKALWRIPYFFVALFPSLKQNFIAYRSSKASWRPDWIFEIHQLWQSGFCRVYSNCCCSCSFQREIIKIGQSSHKMYSNNIMNIQESTTILNASTKKSGNLLNAPYIYIYIYSHPQTDCFYIYIYAHARVWLCVRVCLWKYQKQGSQFIRIWISCQS